MFADRSIQSFARALAFKRSQFKTLKITWYTAEINVDSEFHVLFTSYGNIYTTGVNQSFLRVMNLLCRLGRIKIGLKGGEGGWRLNKGRSHAEKRGEEQTTK